MNVVEELTEHAENPPSLPHRTISIVGFALLFVASSLYMKLVVAPLATNGLPQGGGLPTTCFLVSGILVGLVCGLRGVRCCQAPRPHRLASAAVFFLAGVILWALANTTGPSLTDGTAESAPLMSVSATLVGVADTLLLLAWGRLFSRLPPRESLFGIAVAYTAGTATGMVAAARMPTMAAICLVGVAALASTLLAHMAQGRKYIEPGGSQSGLKHPAPEDSQSAHPYRDATVFLWKPVVGAVLCAFITGASNATGIGSGTKSVPMLLAGVLVIGLALAVALRLPRDLLGLRRFYQVFIPLAAIVLLCIPFLDANVLPGGDIINAILNSCGFALLDIAVIAALSMAVYVLDIPSDTAFGIERALGAGAMLLGVSVQQFVGADGMRTFCAIALAVYLGCIVVSLVRPTSGEKDGHVASPDTSPTARPLSELCRELTERGNLSPREAQILAYLARGRGSTFISEELCISVQTVKTHTKHVYEKLSVHSREELLDLFDEAR